LRNGDLIRGFAKEFVEIVKSARNPAVSSSERTAQAR
jgi:hypothetical protein